MKRLKQHKGLRPTTGKVREALFNILRGRMEDAAFLDLYAGTGAVGIDALKEGASEVVFVEDCRTYAKKISALIKKPCFHGKTAVIAKSALSFIDWAESRRFTFNIIFLDPPYQTDEIIKALSAIESSHILREDGIVAAEHYSKKELPDKFGRLRKLKGYNYGGTMLSFYGSS